MTLPRNTNLKLGGKWKDPKDPEMAFSRVVFPQPLSDPSPKSGDQIMSTSGPHIMAFISHGGHRFKRYVLGLTVPKILSTSAGDSQIKTSREPLVHVL